MKDFKQIMLTIYLALISIPVIVGFAWQIKMHLAQDENSNLLYLSMLFIGVIIITLQWGWHMHSILFKSVIDDDFDPEEEQDENK